MIGFAHLRVMLVVVGATLGAGLLVAIYQKGRFDGAAEATINQLRAGLEAERARRSVDDEARRLSDRDLCLRLGGMPDACERL